MVAGREHDGGNGRQLLMQSSPQTTDRFYRGPRPTQTQLNLNSQLLGASPKQIVELVDIWVDVFSPVNVVTALGGLAAHSKGRGLQGKRMAGHLADVLPILYGHIIRYGELYGPHELSSAAFALAKLQCSSGPVWEVLIREACLTANHFRPGEVAKLLRATVVARVDVPNIFDMLNAVTDTMTRRAAELHPHELADCIWAVTKLSKRSDDCIGDPVRSVYDIFTAQALELMPRFTTFDLATVAWSYASAKHDAPTLFAAIAAASVPLINEFQPKGLSMLLWGFASRGVHEEALFAAAGGRVAATIEEYSVQSASMVIWSYAKVGHRHPQVVDRTLRYLACQPEKLGRARAQHLANLLWAAVRLHRREVPDEFLIAVKVEFTERAREFTAAELVMSIWAFAAAGLTEPRLYHAAWQEVMHRKVGSFTASQMSALVWAFASSRRTAPPLFSMVSRHVPQRLEELTTVNLTSCAWAFATLKYPAPEMMSAIANRVSRRSLAGDASATDLAVTMWAAGVSGANTERLFECVERRLESEPGRFKARELWGIHRAFTAKGQRPPESLLAVMADHPHVSLPSLPLAATATENDNDPSMVLHPDEDFDPTVAHV